MKKILLGLTAVLLVASVMVAGCSTSTQTPAQTSAPTPTVVSGTVTDVDLDTGRVTIIGMYDEQEIYVETTPETRIILGDEECDLKTLEREWMSASGDIVIRVVCFEGENLAYWMLSDHDIAQIGG